MCLSKGLLPWHHVAPVDLPFPISRQHGTPSRRGHAVGKYPAASCSVQTAHAGITKVTASTSLSTGKVTPHRGWVGGEVQQSFKDKSDFCDCGWLLF